MAQPREDPTLRLTGRRSGKRELNDASPRVSPRSTRNRCGEAAEWPRTRHGSRVAADRDDAGTSSGMAIVGARERAASGRPRLIRVRGEAGIGKSRLVMDAMDRARAAGSALLHGTCLDLEGEGLPYLPVVAAFRNYVRSTPPEQAIEMF